MNEGELSIELMDKISMFLKICSGSYNLSPYNQEEYLINKYKNAKVYNYVVKLLKVLGE